LTEIDAQQAIRQAKKALQRGDVGEAQRLALLAARLDPADETPWLIMAAVAAPQASLAYLNKALELNPGSESARKGLVWAAGRLRQEQAAAPLPEAQPQVPPVMAVQPEPPTAESPRVVLQTAPDGEITQPVRVQPQSAQRRFLFWARPKAAQTPSPAAGASALGRVVKYTALRGITLFATVIASVFLIIYIANLGGYLDTIQKGLISEDINAMLMSGWLRDTGEPERQQTIDQVEKQMEASFGLDQPYTQRVLNWLVKGVTLDWGKSRQEYAISSTYVDGTHTRDVLTRDIKTEILSYLPRTLLLLGLSNLGLFLTSVVIALLLTRKPGSWVDRVLTALAPTSAAPSWMYGLVLIIVFYRVLRETNYSLGFNTWTTTFDLSFVPKLLRGLFLPFLAIFLSKFFQSIYSWRAYFLTFSNESYIELARAKGLPASVLERRYLLRPALPSIITSFALIMISIWQECIAVEYFFNVGGIGGFFVQALANNEIGVIVALVTTFAYFLAITVFILDIVYALVDPRLKIQSSSQSERPYHPGSWTGTAFGWLRRVVAPRRSPRLTFRPIRGAAYAVKKPGFADRLHTFRLQLAGVGYSVVGFWRDLRNYPSAIVGLGIILILVLISIGTVLVIPYARAISLWRGDDRAWIRNPIEAAPAWTNFFRQQKLPENIQLNSLDGGTAKEIKVDPKGNTSITLEFRFDYAYDEPPQDVLVLFDPHYTSKQPFVWLTWITPDGREIPLKNIAARLDTMFRVSTDTDVANKLRTAAPVDTLFARPGGQPGEVLKGTYRLRINGFTFEKESSLDAELVIAGKVYGLAGTDRQRRDLLLVLLWGTVAALSFGILAAIGTTLASVTLAAAGAWFGGWVDGLIQRISEINMVLPILPTSILIFYLYSKSFWVILGVTVGLSIFGNSVKNYRAMFLQIKQSAYIEAASAYGASGWRIIMQYLIPRVRSVLIPQLVILVPSYIFFESTLSFLGVSDPFLPTLGKMLVTTLQAGLAGRPIFLLLEPVGMLVLIAFGFALLGFALERLFNEKLGI